MAINKAAPNSRRHGILRALTTLAHHRVMMNRGNMSAVVEGCKSATASGGLFGSNRQNRLAGRP
jgi:hypothetical protein